MWLFHSNHEPSDAQVAPPVALNAWTAFQRSALLGRPAKPKHDESGNNGVY